MSRLKWIATIYTKPIYVFKELIHYLENHQIVIPGYSFMQEDIVGKALNDERNRLENEVINYISDHEKKALDTILSAEDNSLYELTLLKKEPRDFSYKEITTEVGKGESLKELYYVVIDFLPKLEISNENIKYYASLVSYYTVYKLKRMKRETAYVYLICFVFNRYQKINDNIVNTFVYYVNKAQYQHSCGIGQ